MPSVLVEPSRAPSPSRRSPLALSRARLGHLTIADAALGAAGVLVVSGRGDLWVLAVLFGLADASAVAVLVTAAAGSIALDRFGSAALGDIAGAQAVLGPAALYGQSAELAAGWLVSIALLLMARRRASAAVAGALAGVLLFGPSVVASFAATLLHVTALVGGALLGWSVASLVPRPRRVLAALVLPAIGVIAAIWISV